MGKNKTGNKEKILKKATDLFLEKGFHGTTTNDICQAANINAPTLYYYFKNKQHLFLSCHMKDLQENLKPYLVEAEAIDDPNERLLFMIDGFTRLICSNPELRVLIHETLSMKDKDFKLVREEWRKHYQLLEASISQLQSKGAARQDIKSSWAALLLLGTMTWITFWFDYSRKNEIDNLAETVSKLVLHGLLDKTEIQSG